MSDDLESVKGYAARCVTRTEELRGEVERRRSGMTEARRHAKPGRGKLAVGWFAIWDRGVGPLAAAVGKLERMERRTETAQRRAIEVDRRARKKEVRAREKERLKAALARTAEAADAAAAEYQKKAASDRAAEARRIEKMKKALRRRTTKDLSQPARPFMGYSLAPTVAPLPDFEVKAPQVAPPRDGIFPGDFKLIDDADEIAVPVYRPPAIWTPRHVGLRLVEAAKVVRRLPANVWPKGYGAMWPDYRHEGVELAYQAGAGTLGKGSNRVRIPVTADDVARMNEAITWPMEVFAKDERAARSVTEWIDDEVWAGGDYVSDGPIDLLRRIAEWLNERKVPVR